MGVNSHVQEIVNCFILCNDLIESPRFTYTSNEVLEILRKHLAKIPMKIETGKSKGSKISIPVLFGLNNTIDKSFDADAVTTDGKIVLEVEAGRAVDNYQFLKDIFQACMMHGVEYLAIAVRNDYRGNDDFKKIYTFLETLYISNRLNLPLKGIILIGY
jgi:hypothetical protein